MPSYEHSLFYYLSKLPSSVKHHPLPFILLPCFSISPFFLFIVSSNLHILSSFLLHLYPLSSFPPSLFPLIHRSLPFILLPCSSLPLFFSWSPHSLFPEIFRIVPPPTSSMAPRPPSLPSPLTLPLYHSSTLPLCHSLIHYIKRLCHGPLPSHPHTFLLLSISSPRNFLHHFSPYRHASADPSRTIERS